MKRWVEYIWLDHDNNYRSKTRILNDDGSAGSFSISKLPIWNFDGSSTEQADGEDSEVYIKPVYMVRDPFRRQCDSWLVLCDTWLPDGNPHPDNTRVNAMKIFSQKVVRESETWFGLEQEFFIRKAVKSYPVGWIKICILNRRQRIFKDRIIVVWVKEIVPRENLWKKPYNIW